MVPLVGSVEPPRRAFVASKFFIKKCINRFVMHRLISFCACEISKVISTLHANALCVAEGFKFKSFRTVNPLPDDLASWFLANR
jgi:hypothetical protein